LPSLIEIHLKLLDILHTHRQTDTNSKQATCNRLSRDNRWSGTVWKRIWICWLLLEYW